MPALEDVRGALKEKDELDQEPIVAPEDTAMAASSSAAAAADSLLLNLMDEPTTSAGSTPSPAAPANLLAELAGNTPCHFLSRSTAAQVIHMRVVFDCVCGWITLSVTAAKIKPRSYNISCAGSGQFVGLTW